MGNCFDTAIQRTNLHGNQVGTQPVQGLMVGTVDHSLLTINRIKPGMPGYGGDVIDITVFVLVEMCGRHILVNGSAKPHIYDLHPLTDA